MIRCTETDRMKVRLLTVFLFVGLILNCYGMTREQVKKSMGLMKTPCMKANSVTEDQVSGIEQGTFLEDRNVKCYIACVFNKMLVVKNDKLDMALISKQIDLLYPQDLKEPVKTTIKLCIHTQDKYQDMCDGIFYATKCLYETEPSHLIFP